MRKKYQTIGYFLFINKIIYFSFVNTIKFSTFRKKSAFTANGYKIYEK